MINPISRYPAFFSSTNLGRHPINEIFFHTVILVFSSHYTIWHYFQISIASDPNFLNAA